MIFSDQKGELHFLFSNASEAGSGAEARADLLLYCPQRREGMLLSVDGFGRPEMSLRVLRSHLTSQDLAGQVDPRSKSEITGVYQFLTLEKRMGFAYRLGPPGSEPSSATPEMGFYLTECEGQGFAEALGSGRSLRFAELQIDGAVAAIRDTLTKYGKRRKPSPLLGRTNPKLSREEIRRLNFERVSSIQNVEFDRPVTCYRCEKSYYARHNLLGKHIDCPNCMAELTVKEVLKPPHISSSKLDIALKFKTKTIVHLDENNKVGRRNGGGGWTIPWGTLFVACCAVVLVFLLIRMGYQFAFHYAEILKSLIE